MLARQNRRIFLWMGFAVVALLIFAGTSASGALAGYSAKIASPPIPGKAQTTKPNKSVSATSSQQVKPGQPAAPYAILYDQYDNPGTQASTSQDFEVANDPYDNQGADDFVVPGGQT